MQISANVMEIKQRKGSVAEARSSQLSEIGPLDFQAHVIYVEMKLETQILYICFCQTKCQISNLNNQFFPGQTNNFRLAKCPKLSKPMFSLSDCIKDIQSGYLSREDTLCAVSTLFKTSSEKFKNLQTGNLLRADLNKQLCFDLSASA